VDTFTPGEQIIIRGSSRHATPTMRTVKLTFPARVHVTLLDANRFDVGQPGAGGLGFAVRMQNLMEVSLADRDHQESAGNYQPVLAHITLVMKKLLGFGGGIRVTLQCDPGLRLHSGLGSTVSIMTACAQGINILFGCPFGTDEVRTLVGHNYAEAHQGKLVRGTETGVGSYLALHGGFVVVASDLTVVYARPFLPAQSVVLVFPRVRRFPNQEPQNRFELERIKREDAAFRYHKAYLVLMDLIPALYRRDLTIVGDVIWRLQFGGNNLLEFEKYPHGGHAILEIMRTVRYGCEPRPIVGISSLGPTVFVAHRDPEVLKRLSASCDAEEYLITDVDNDGLRIADMS
jgi:beta-ribofuranosylaminobenzene 5'-phosphate synthase